MRPRERLLFHGVSSLSRRELLQVVIGSGTARATSAELARLVELSLQSRETTITGLMEIPGIGQAKACQLVAALELGRRVVSGE